MTSSIHCPIFCKDVAEHLRVLYARTRDLETWLRVPPKYTTVRVNFPKDMGEACRKLQDIINAKYAIRNKHPPIVYVHHFLKDLLIIHSPSCNTPEKTPNKEVIVDVHCGSAVLRGADIYAPGVLSVPPHLQPGDNVTVYADLEGKCLKGFQKPFAGVKLFLGVGTATLNRQDLFGNNRKTTGVAVVMTDTVNNCPSLGADVLGSSMFLQNLPSVVCSHVLNPKPSDLVLDMCAAPGGKTTHMASIMQNEGIIVALDKTKPRVAKLNSNIALTGYTNVHTFVFDATKAVDTSKDFSDGIVRNGVVAPPPYPPSLFDCILLDAPCSALGQRPQLSNKMTLKELQSYPPLQRNLISVATQLLKPTGHLVYSTCSLTLEENESIVSWMLAKHPHMELVHQNPFLAGPGRAVTGLSSDDLGKLQRFDLHSPGQAEDADTIGFFIAKFRKKAMTPS